MFVTSDSALNKIIITRHQKATIQTDQQKLKVMSRATNFRIIKYDLTLLDRSSVIMRLYFGNLYYSNIGKAKLSNPTHTHTPALMHTPPQTHIYNRLFLAIDTKCQELFLYDGHQLTLFPFTYVYMCIFMSLYVFKRVQSIEELKSRSSDLRHNQRVSTWRLVSLSWRLHDSPLPSIIITTALYCFSTLLSPVF